jgi:hypothetical protein
MLVFSIHKKWKMSKWNFTLLGLQFEFNPRDSKERDEVLEKLKKENEILLNQNTISRILLESYSSNPTAKTETQANADTQEMFKWLIILGIILLIVISCKD